MPRDEHQLEFCFVRRELKRQHPFKNLPAHACSPAQPDSTRTEPDKKIAIDVLRARFKIKPDRSRARRA
jgi:hypothetical protein